MSNTNACRARHHHALKGLHTDPENADGLSMWRALRRIEAIASNANEDACNTPEGADRQEGILDGLEEQVKEVFGGCLPGGFFINRDPRGYALKLDNEQVTIPDGLGTDWGGYGILAQEIK
tara:strand:- start:2471 stop:2833 length:363 start_codon:yes stop_codon:yes gene_type:complete